MVVEWEKHHASAAIGSILESHVFQRTHRLSELLGFLAERTLKGDGQPVKEAEIGHFVFGRPPGYNTSDDTIVRANIRQLRMKLDEYYQSEGLQDPWRVSIPKGSYALRIESRVANAPAPPAEPPQRNRRIPTLLAGAAAIVCAGCLIYARMNQPPASQPAVHTLLSLLYPGPGQRLLIIGPDANVQLFQRLTHHTVSLQEYQNRDYLRSPALGPNSDVYFASSITESFILNLIPPFTRVIPPEAMLVRAPDLVRMQDFQVDNALLISGPFGNPWVQLFDKPLNFQIRIDDESAPAYIVNRNPLPGEAAVYRNYNDDTRTTVCFARLAYLPGITPRTHVLLAGGPHQASTEAVNFFLTRSDQLDLVREALHVLPGTPLPSFEAVVEARAVGRDPWSMKFAAIRRVTQ